MVKISGKQRGARHLAEHFGYISRHGKLEIRSSEGEIITDEKRLKAIAADWDMLDQAMNAYGKDRPTSMSMVLSRSEEHTSELQSLMRISYAVFCLNKKKHNSCITSTRDISHTSSQHRMNV